MASYAVSVPDVGSSDSVITSRLDEGLPEADELADTALLPGTAAFPEGELLLEVVPLLAQADTESARAARRAGRQRVGDMANSIGVQVLRAGTCPAGCDKTAIEHAS
jgi:hypothetical protein